MTLHIYQRKEFYKGLLSMRYERILIPTLQKIFQRTPEQIAKATEALTAEDLRSVSQNEILTIRNTEPFVLSELNFGNGKDPLIFRKANDRFAILYNQNEEITGIAPIRKDFKDVKVFIYEADNALGHQLQQHRPRENNPDIYEALDIEEEYER